MEMKSTHQYMLTATIMGLTAATWLPLINTETVKSGMERDLSKHRQVSVLQFVIWFGASSSSACFWLARLRTINLFCDVRVRRQADGRTKNGTMELSFSCLKLLFCFMLSEIVSILWIFKFCCDIVMSHITPVTSSCHRCYINVHSHLEVNSESHSWSFKKSELTSVWMSLTGDTFDLKFLSASKYIELCLVVVCTLVCICHIKSANANVQSFRPSVKDRCLILRRHTRVCFRATAVGQRKLDILTSCHEVLIYFFSSARIDTTVLPIELTACPKFDFSWLLRYERTHTIKWCLVLLSHNRNLKVITWNARQRRRQ